MSAIHPARLMTFAELSDALQAAKAAKLVSEQEAAGLSLYCYTKSCVYDRAWTDAALMARGLILDKARGRIVATPFPKFFNVGERAQPIPALEFETFEKLDGSLIIIFWHDGEWRTATKGSLISSQADWAARWLSGCDLSKLQRGTTYLAEAIYAENRIIVHYGETALFLLAAYDEGGEELPYDELVGVADALGWPIAKRHPFVSMADLMARAEKLSANEEGFVLRFANGLRLKVKGEEYRRIHALVSRVTPLAVWEAMQAGDDLSAMRRDLPEEFWADFDAINILLSAHVAGVIAEVGREAQKVAHLSDKEVGLQLAQFPADVRGFIFPYRKYGGDLLLGRYRSAVFRHIRPSGNRLDGYVPSSGVAALIEEAG